MDPRTEALLKAVQDEADNLGCSGDHFSMRMSDMLDRIVRRARIELAQLDPKGGDQDATETTMRTVRRRSPARGQDALP